MYLYKIEVIAPRKGKNQVRNISRTWSKEANSVRVTGNDKRAVVSLKADARKATQIAQRLQFKTQGEVRLSKA